MMKYDGNLNLKNQLKTKGYSYLTNTCRINIFNLVPKLILNSNYRLERIASSLLYLGFTTYEIRALLGNIRVKASKTPDLYVIEILKEYYGHCCLDNEPRSMRHYNKIRKHMRELYGLYS